MQYGNQKTDVIRSLSYLLINAIKRWHWKALGNCKHRNKPSLTMKNMLTSWLKTQFNREWNYVIREIHNNLYRLQSYLTVDWFFVANTSDAEHYSSNSSVRQHWEGGSGIQIYVRNVDWHASTEESTLISGRGYEDSAKIDVNNLGVKWRVKI
jgi:hypothetical protein